MVAEDPRLKISIVSPAYNEEEGIGAFYRELCRVTEQAPEYDWEFLFVEDGSKDQTLKLLLEIAADDPRVRVIAFARNFGHQLAITCGLDRAEGDAVAVIDSDLQDPPAVILDFLHEWREGADVVYGQRRDRAGETRFKKGTAALYYRIIRRLTDVDMPVGVGDFRLMDRRVVDALNEMREENRYVRGMISWIGFTQVGVEYDRDPRMTGKSHYSLPKMLKLAADGVTSFSEKPLRLASITGGLIFAITLLAVMYTFISRLVQPSASNPGFATITLLVMFFGSVQLLSIGLLGEYVGRIYRESKARPLYVVRMEAAQSSMPSLGRVHRQTETHTRAPAARQ